MEHLRCVVERITYQNSENGYTVLKAAVKNYADLVTIVGIMPDTHVGSVLFLEGMWKMDAKYGRQFSVTKWEETLPATVYGMEKYLGSGLIKGVGPKFAKRIVQKYGKDTLDIIEEDPDRLLDVEGIGKVRVERIKQSWQEQKEIKNIMLFLQSHDVNTSHATKIYKTYGQESISVVTENPYRLADDIWGIGFVTADTIAQKMGMEKDKFVRLRSGILYALNKLAENGHCYAVRDQLIKKAAELLEVEEPELEITLDEMLRTKDIVKEEEAIYLASFYYAETGCAKRLLALMEAENRIRIQPERVLDAICKNAKVTYDEIQLQAVRTAITSKVMVLTGGPGTGKTTTILGIISAFQAAGCRISLAAPTGRAAKRMAEATGMEAKTIHRLLEYKPPNGYAKNQDNPLDTDVLILDECSMIDQILMYNLLKALPDYMTLILTGDTDQLPSVGAGNVLKDIIHSGRVPVVRLTRIFRQAQGSRIIMNAHRINKGEPIDMRGGRDADFFFAAKETDEEITELLIRYCTTNLPRYYHVDPLQDIQVLTPMQKGVCGAANLNKLLQEAMNPTDLCLRRGGVRYGVRDKVMQIRNNYDKEVFNGDIGIISKVDLTERELWVDFDGREISYDISELDELTLAYACTIHKSQGSEYPIVVMPVTMAHYIMLQRNLLYTGVTRAKKILVMIGSKKAVSCAIRTVSAMKRNTMLDCRLAQDREMETETEENPSEMRHLFQRLAASSFRSSFHLSPEDVAYIHEKGLDTIREHAEDFVLKRLAPAEPVHDGKQTPIKGHPVFVAQHATGTCCRGCLEKWHKIFQGRPLTEEQQEYVVHVIMAWIKKELEEAEKENKKEAGGKTSWQ